MLTLSFRVKQGDRELFCALTLIGVPGVGSVIYRRLIERFGGAEVVFRAGRGALERVKGLRKDAMDAIIFTSDPVRAGRDEWERARNAGFKLARLGTAGYPANLSEIYDPPPILYVSGELSDGDLAAVAVVGSRNPTDYGRKTADRITSELASAGVTIVSGMARGIDSAAHRAALAAGGRTIAVLGSGLDVIYPPENKELFSRISKNGAVISSFSMGTRPERGNFPARNRLISGLSLGVVIVQATRPDSGSLITARHALEQGREVFAVPGSITASSSMGTNRLIKRGEAKLIENATDVLEEILPQLRAPSPEGNVKKGPPAPKPRLNANEKAVYDRTGDEPRHIDNIARECNIPVHELAAVLLSLELKGLVSQKPGKNYVRS